MYAAAAGARIEYRLLSIPGFVKLHPEIKFDTQGPRIMGFLFLGKNFHDTINDDFYF